MTAQTELQPDPAASNAPTQGAAGDNPPAEQPPADQEQPTGMSEVSDITSLTAEVAKSYEGFDPSRHATNPDGSPIPRKGGGWQLKRGRKAGSMSAPSPGAPPSGQIGDVAQLASANGGPKIDNTTAAKMCAGLSVAGMQMLLGPEWDVEDANERKALIDAVKSYLDATGGMDVTPMVGLLFAYGGYALPRIPKPETQSRLRRFGSWCMGLVRRNK